MTGHRHPLEHKAVVVSFHQRIGPAPIDVVPAIGADSLEMARISALAGRGMKVIGGTNAVQTEKSESEKDVSHHFSGEGIQLQSEFWVVRLSNDEVFVWISVQ
jgi:hypothetical protein